MTPITLSITGSTPLLCGRPAPDAVTDGDPRRQAAERLYIGSDGVPVVPGLNCFRCFLNAAKHLERTPIDLVHAIGVAERELPIRSSHIWAVDSRYVRHPQTGERRLCHRPRYNDWRLDLTLLIDRDVLSVELARELIEKAGQRIGLGDYRPERNGPFGRFQISNWSP